MLEQALEDGSLKSNSKEDTSSLKLKLQSIFGNASDILTCKDFLK